MINVNSATKNLQNVSKDYQKSILMYNFYAL